MINNKIKAWFILATKKVSRFGSEVKKAVKAILREVI